MDHRTLQADHNGPVTIIDTTLAEEQKNDATSDDDITPTGRKVNGKASVKRP